MSSNNCVSRYASYTNQHENYLEGSENTCILIKSLPLSGFSGNVSFLVRTSEFCSEDMEVEMNI